MINKSKNTTLQITLSKANHSALLEIQSELNDIFSIELTKSQVIEYLIKNYQNKGKSQTKEQKAKSENKSRYQLVIIELRDKLNVSYTGLSQIIGIPQSTLKKYGGGKQEPQGENKRLIDELAEKYQIKI